jgi:hypothetical protein
MADCYSELDVPNFNETKQNFILCWQKWKNRVVENGKNCDILCIYRKRFPKKKKKKKIHFNESIKP